MQKAYPCPPALLAIGAPSWARLAVAGREGESGSEVSCGPSCACEVTYLVFLHRRELSLNSFLVFDRHLRLEHLVDLLLVGNRVGRLSHELLDVFDLHLVVELLEHGRALLEAIEDILLDTGELDALNKLLQCR